VNDWFDFYRRVRKWTKAAVDNAVVPEYRVDITASQSLNEENMEPEDIFQVGVKILVINDEGKILLLRSNSLAAGSVYWDFPGGRIRRDESVLSALTRELFEETGIHLDETRLHFVGAHMTGIRIPYRESDSGLIFFVHRFNLEENCNIQLSSEHTHFWWATREETAKEMQTSTSTY
jgi:8-oxo-dGTP pyrophosphatase MutT (NUDIX family)